MDWVTCLSLEANANDLSRPWYNIGCGTELQELKEGREKGGLPIIMAGAGGEIRDVSRLAVFSQDHRLTIDAGAIPSHPATADAIVLAYMFACFSALGGAC